jgi:saccharopine dehydrogenase-like NADP-dependent oxidoreductase
MRVVIQGCGRSGWRAALDLGRYDDVELVLVDAISARAEALRASLGTQAEVMADRAEAVVAADLVVLCLPREAHGRAARAALSSGASVVSNNDDMDEVRALLDLDAEAFERGQTIVVGAGFSPGLSCLLARHAAMQFDAVDEVHVCRAGTGGPGCARQHHAALSGHSLDWRDGGWLDRRGRSGRQLAHFPDPVGPRDCYRGSLPDALLLRRAFPDAQRLTARLAATRRDRFTAPLPMLRPPHPDGGPGGTRVEVWGRRDGAREVTIYGAVGSPAEISGIVAAMASRRVLDGAEPPGARGLAELLDPLSFLAELDQRGVHPQTFEGAG